MSTPALFFIMDDADHAPVALGDLVQCNLTSGGAMGTYSYAASPAGYSLVDMQWSGGILYCILLNSGLYYISKFSDSAFSTPVVFPNPHGNHVFSAANLLNGWCVDRTSSPKIWVANLSDPRLYSIDPVSGSVVTDTLWPSALNQTFVSFSLRYVQVVAGDFIVAVTHAAGTSLPILGIFTLAGISSANVALSQSDSTGAAFTDGTSVMVFTNNISLGPSPYKFDINVINMVTFADTATTIRSLAGGAGQQNIADLDPILYDSGVNAVYVIDNGDISNPITTIRKEPADSIALSMPSSESIPEETHTAIGQDFQTDDVNQNMIIDGVSDASSNIVFRNFNPSTLATRADFNAPYEWINGDTSTDYESGGNPWIYAPYAGTPPPTFVGGRVISGTFQDPSGAPITNGTLTMRLNIDGLGAGSVGSQVAGLEFKLSLDSNGVIVGPPTVWANDALTPATVYLCRVYTAQGEPVCSFQATVPSGSGTYSITG